MNFDEKGLPEKCFYCIDDDGVICISIRGKMHEIYTALDDDGSPLYGRETCDLLNADIGVNRAQEKAMMVGSLFGFDHPMANPACYDQYTGKMIDTKIGKKEVDFEKRDGNNLPESCFTDCNGRLGLIVRYEKEIRLCEGHPFEKFGAERANQLYGYKKSEVSAMENGCKFGWNHPLTDPSLYDDETGLLKEEYQIFKRNFNITIK